MDTISTAQDPTTMRLNHDSSLSINFRQLTWQQGRTKAFMEHFASIRLKDTMPASMMVQRAKKEDTTPLQSL